MDHSELAMALVFSAAGVVLGFVAWSYIAPHLSNVTTPTA